MKKPVVSFRIEPEQRAALDSLCAATGKEGTFHMRQALEQYLELEHLKALHASVKVPNLCNGCGCNLDYVQCWCALDKFEMPINANHVGIVSNPPDPNAKIVSAQRCELGEHCRCQAGDEPGCWNWPE